MPTLAALIKAHEARQSPAETPAVAGLTQRGHAALLVLKLERDLLALPVEDRAYVRRLIAERLAHQES